MTVRLLDRVAHALAAPGNPDERLTGTAAAIADELSARHCTISEVHGGAIHPAAAVSRTDDDLPVRFLASRPLELSDHVRQLLAAGTAAVFGDREAARLVPGDWGDILPMHALALVPARHRDRSIGLLTLDWADPPAPAVEALGVLTPLIGIGIYDSMHHATGDVSPASLAFLDELRTILVDANDVSRGIQGINDLLARAGIAIEVERIAVRDRSLREQVGGEPPTVDELQRAREVGDVSIARREGELWLPLRDGRRFLGTLSCRTGRLPRPQIALALVHEVAHWLRQLQLVALLDAAYEERARTRVRDEAWSRHLDLAVLDAAALVPPENVALVAGAFAQARTLARDVADLVPGGRRGLPLRTSLRRLVRVIDQRTTASVSFATRGRGRSLPPSRERVLYLAAASILRAAVEGAWASIVRVLLVFHDDHVEVQVRDTGAPLVRRTEAAAAHYAEAESLMGAAGGTLRAVEHLPSVVGGGPAGATVTVSVLG